MKETNFDLEFENFYCPVTRKQVLDTDQLNHSSDTVFPFLDTEDVFKHPQKDLVEKFAKEVKDETRHRELDQKHTEYVITTYQNYLWITYGFARTASVSFCFDMVYKIQSRSRKKSIYYLKSFSEDN